MRLSNRTRAGSPAGFDESPRRGRLRRRALALGAFGVFLGGLLAAVGLGRTFVSVVFLAAPAAVVAAAVGGVGWLVWRYRVWTVAGTGARRLARPSRTALHAADVSRRATVRVAVAAPRMTRSASWRVSAFALRPRQPWQPPAAVTAAILGARRAYGALLTRTVPARQKAYASWQALAATILERSFALAGRIRRRVTGLVARRGADRRAEALSLNSAALALMAAGDDEAAIDHFERAAEILHDIGEPEAEGRVIANLAVTHRRQGRRAEAARLLETALEKLDPESPAHRQVEQQLRRAV